MSISQSIEAAQSIPPRHYTTYELSSTRSALARVTDVLDAALQLWDADRVQARSQVSVAAGLLRGYADYPSSGAKQQPEEGGRRGLAPWQARKAKEFIDVSLETPIRLKDCASKVRLSSSHFSRAFKATFGMSVCNFIRHRRVERAQQLMLRTSEPLSQIALACGFSDQAQYSRVFRVVTGTSPKLWRHRNLTVAPGD
jgi:AraC-like DNA-binding protein